MVRTPMRINVLLLVGGGYLAVVIIFVAMAVGSMTAEEAYEVVKGPLMALIGGSLAIAKDLIPIGDDSNSGTGNMPTSPPNSPGNAGDDEAKDDQKQGS